ncbi:MAG: 30S ribosomal protein S1 [candidate division WS1 bacterium]|nr:30S ribosomal protein S1 [candidate division WS1 bacterium]
MSAWDFEDRKDEESAPDAAAAAPDEDQTQPVEEPQDAKAAEAPQAEVAPEASPEEDEPLSMDDVDLDAVGPAALKPNAIVRGVVAAVTEDGVLVDVGGKAEGIVPIYEFLDRSEMPERDDEIEVAVVKLQDEDGLTILSKKRADYERVWNRVVEAMETGEIVDAMVTDRVKGGLRVDLGVAGFVPASHVATRDVRNLDRFVGRSLRLKVLEADRDRKKVVLSHRMVVEEERQERRAETLARLQEGLVCEGKVRNITEYGAFIDLGGVDGLLHVSEMSWGRIEHPSDVCSVGDTLRVVVLEIDTDRDRISLGRRQILPDPWKEVGKELRPGSMVRGKVSRIVRTGAFIDLADFEVEGFLPVGELSEKRIDSPSEVIEEGQELELKVLKLRPQARRLTLSLAAALEEKERREYQKYMADQDEPKTTLGDQFADVLGAVAAEMDEDEAAEEPAAEEPVAEEPVAEEPVAEEPVAEEPVAEEPVAEEPVAEAESAEEPAEEESAAEEEAAEEEKE